MADDRQGGARRPMRRGWLLGGAALLGASLAAPFAAAQDARPKGTIHAVVQPEPSNLMQGLFQNGPTNMVAGNIYESLLRYDEKLNPQPSLATKWEVSPDNRVFTFHLREGVTWHDGKPFSADDVVFSLDTFLREVHPRWRLIVNGQVERIEKLDQNTVRITAKQPFGPLIYAMEVATTPIIPRHLYEGTDYRANPANATPIGTGPFKLKEWKRGSYIHLVKHEGYNGGGPKLDEVYWRIIPDAAARAIAFEKGDVDVLTGGSVEIFDVPRLAKLPNACVTTKGWEMFAPHAWLTLNVRQGPLADKRFRQAMMYAIDREFGRDVIWSGYGKIPTGPISSKTKFYSADVKTYAYDPAKAKALLKEMGYKGEPIRFLNLPYGETWARWGEAIRQNLDEVGIKTEVVTTDVAGWTQRTANWDFDVTFNFIYQLGDPAIGVSRSYVSSNIAKGSPFANVGGYANGEVDRLFAAAAVAPTEPERQRLYADVQKALVEDVPLVWLLEMDFPTVTRCNVKDLVTTAIGVNDGFKTAYKE